MVRCNNAGAEEGVEIFRAAIGTLPRQAARTMELTGAKMLGSINGDQRSSGQWAIRTAEWIEHALGRDRFEE